MGLRSRLATLSVVLLGAPVPARAEEVPGQAPGSGVEIHGFVSPGFLSTTRDVDYIARDSNKGSFEFAEAGVNFTKRLSDDLRVGLQLFSRDLGASGNYTAKLDWFYLDYRWRDWLGVRAGRVKIPLGLYNDSSDVDSARVQVLLPQSVYPAQNRDFLLAQTGGEVYGHTRSGLLGALDYRLYGGTIFLETTVTPGLPYEVGALSIPYVVGGRLLWETPLPGFRLGGSVQALKLEADLHYSEPEPEVVTLELPALLSVGSAELAWGPVSAAAEYALWDVETRSSNPALFPEGQTTSERAYGMVSVSLTPRFHAGAYYSMYYPDRDERTDVEDRLFDAAASLRFDMTPQWLVKAEGHYMDGKAGVSQRLNDRPLDELPDQWGLFLVKTTVYF